MTYERVHELARGRVWTGADAHERGLVDELGGLHRAAELARERAGLPDDAPLRRWPQTSPLDRLSPPRSSEDPAAAARGRLVVRLGSAGRHRRPPRPEPDRPARRCRLSRSAEPTRPRAGSSGDGCVSAP